MRVRGADPLSLSTPTDPRHREALSPPFHEAAQDMVGPDPALTPEAP